MNRELFKELVDRYNAGLATAQEQSFIEAYYAAFEGRPDIVKELSPSEQLQLEALLYQPISSAIAAADPVSHVSEATPGKASEAPVPPLRFLRKWRWAAACLILALGIGTILYFFRQEPPKGLAGEAHSVPADILPGSNKAILTLSDGRRVALDSAETDLINDGELAIQQKNGVLLYNETGPVLINTLHTPNGGQYQLTLADGTRVWLNAASSITYPTVFSGTERKVRISGEAYFEVAKSKTQPFYVNINDQSEVEVLGTHFNVNAYKNENSINTTLLEGSVRIRLIAQKPSLPHNKALSGPAVNSASVILKPGQLAHISVNNVNQGEGRPALQNNSAAKAVNEGISVLNDVNLDKVIAWKNGFFNFEGTKLQEVMRQLERWYDIEVVYQNGVPDITVGGEMTRDVTLNGLLVVLDRLGIHSSLQGRILTILL